MIKGLQLALLGKPQLTLDGQRLTGFQTTKTEALLYYLAVTGRPHSREVLADLLWGDMPESKAKRNLTKALSNLRQLVEPYLLIDRQAQHLAEELGSRSSLGLALTHVGHALAGLERFADAEAVYQQALDLRRDLSEPGPALSPQAGLIRVYLAQGSPERAQTHLEAILRHLETSPDLAGLEEPFRIGLTCYRALQAGRDPRARPFLEKIHTLLHERTANISDPTLRRSFLENVSFHCDLVNAFRHIDNPP
jgi:tetratricopeptide (TPR) repeat protein